MNVESVQIVTQSSKTKNVKADVQKDRFLQIYAQSINEEEQSKGKSDANGNLSVKSNVLDEKNANGLEGVETSETLREETDLDAVNDIGMSFHMDIYRNKQVNLNAFGLEILEKNESQSNIEDTSAVLSVIWDENNMNSVQEQFSNGLPIVNIQKINDSITQLMKTTTQGETSVMEIGLYPEELGSIEVAVKMEDGKWTTKVLVDHEEIKELLTNKINESRSSTIKQNVNIDTVQIEVKVNSIEPKTNSLATNSENASLVKDQSNLDTTLMANTIPREEVSSEKNVTDSTQIIEAQDKGTSILEKQEVNFNVREFATKQLNYVGHAKEVVLPEENLQKVNDSIVKLMETTSQGNASVMKVRLYPEELGSVDVTLKIEDGKMIAKILVDNEQIKQLFTNKINELSNNLVKQNINIDKIQIDVNSSANFSSGSNQNKGNYSKRNNRSPFDTESTDNMTTQDKSERSGAISILA